jgi:hypothetical protein
MFMRTKFGALLLSSLLVASALSADRASAADTPTAVQLQRAFAVLHRATFVDLTHTFGPDAPHWKGFSPETVTTLYTIPKDGFHVQSFCHVGQWGTHVDPPAHFHEGLKTVDQIDPKEFLLPLVVLDIHDTGRSQPGLCRHDGGCETLGGQTRSDSRGFLRRVTLRLVQTMAR